MDGVRGEVLRPPQATKPAAACAIYQSFGCLSLISDPYNS